MVLSYDAAYADALAADWGPRVAAGPNLSVYWRHAVPVRPKLVNGKLIAKLHPVPTGAPVSVTVTAALWAIGAGEENTSASAYHGYRFWDTDPYDQPDLGLGPTTLPTVLISGGGDGALQDLFRVVFDPAKIKYPRDLLHLVGGLPAAEREELALAEEQAQRALIWNGGDHEQIHDHSVLEHLHDVHARIAFQYAFRPAVAAEIQTLFRTPFPEITLVHSCEHFSRCYALNRFVALLVIATALKNKKIRYVRNAGIASVTATRSGGVTHACSNARTCHGKDHDVTIARRVCGAPPGSPSPLGSFNVLILRHGLDRPARRKPTLKVRRQLLPYKRL
jgi:hypothetical protein